MMIRNWLIGALIIGLSACLQTDSPTGDTASACTHPESLAQGEDSDYLCLIPQNKRQSLAIYFMSNDCPGCGSWGTQLFHEILEENAGKVNPLQVHIKYSDPWIVEGFADSMVARFNPNYTPFNMLEDYPLTGRFQVNSNFPAVKAKAKADIEANYQELPEVSPAINFRMLADSIEIHYGARFEMAVEGEYSLGLYVIEDSLEWNQAGSTKRPYYHENTLRTFAKSPWGPTLISGQAEVGQVVLGKVKVERIGWWKQEDLYLLGVVWKRNALGKVEVVNSVVYRP